MKNTFVKVLSFMMALTMIVGAFGAITVSAADCAHANRTAITVVAPTCGTAGFTSYECDDCGEKFIGDIKNATGEHSWKDVPASKATCDDPAYDAHKECTVCEATDPADLDDVKLSDPLPHVWNIPYAQAATCTEDGFTSRKCAACDKVDDRVAPAGKDPSDEFGWKVVSATDKATHKYVYTVVTEPAKCSSGYIKVTCSACDYTATIEQEVNHTWVTMTTTTKFKADENKACGYEYVSGKFCSKCDTIDPASVKNTTPVHPYAQVTFATITSAEMTADIAGLGYKVGDATCNIAKATCTDAKIYLGVCPTCGDYEKVVEELNNGDGHKWGDWGAYAPADTDANHNVDKTRTRTCTVTGCGAVDTQVKKADGAHNYVKQGDPVAATCFVNGYTNYKCSKCNETTQSDIVYAPKAHTYGAWTYVDGYNCLNSGTTNVCTKTCTKANCANEDGKKTVNGNLSDMGITTAPTAHTWVKYVVGATCMKDAYYREKCSVCYATDGTTRDYKDAATDLPDASYNDERTHVVVLDQTKGTLVENVAAATCTSKKQDKYFCECNELVVVETGATPAHSSTKVTVWHAADCTKAGTTEALASTCKATCKDVSVVKATCQKAGISTAGEICYVCGVITKDPVVEKINAKNHAKKTAADGAKVLSYDMANCASAAYTSTYYPCCGIVDTIYDTTGENGGKDATNHFKFKGQAGSEATMIKKVDRVPATCLANGTEEHYKCEGCGKLFSDLAGTTAITAPTVLKNGGDDKNDFNHDWNTTTVTTGDDKAKAETCTADGTKEYYTCKATGCLAIKIKATGAVVEGYAKDAKASDPINVRYPDLKIAAHGTTYMGWQTGKAPTCTADGYRFKPVTDATKYYTEAAYCCAQCDKIPVGKTNHVGTTKTEYYNCTGFGTDGKPVGVKNCLEPTFTLKVCTECNYTFFETYNAAKTAHTFTKYGDADGDKKGQDKPDVVGTPTCTEAAKDTYECTVCDHSEKRAGAAALGHKIDVNGVKIAVDFGCTSEDHKNYKGFTCANPGCGAKLGDEAKYEHDIIEVKKVEATCTTAGNEAFKYCVDCGTITDGKVEEIPANGHSDNDLISVENGVAKYSCDVCGEYWTKAVDAEAVETLSANKIAAGEVVTYTLAANGKVEFNAETIKVYYDATMLTFVGVEANADLAGLYAFASVNAGSIGVALVVENDAEGNAQKVVTPVDGTTVLFTLTFVANKTASGNVAIGAHPVASERPVVEIAPVGNLNGDAVVTAADAQAIFAKVGSNDAAADVNNDGIVNFADVAALATFAASNKTAKDYLVMVGEYAAIEAEVYALLDAGRLANHDTVTNVINVNDALALIAEIEAGLAGAYATLGNNVTAAAVVAYYNAK